MQLGAEVAWMIVRATRWHVALRHKWPSSLITSQLQNLKSKESWVISDEDPNEDVRF